MLDPLSSGTVEKSAQPHPDASQMSVNCAVITVSDTRTPSTDRSGELVQQLLLAAGHQIGMYRIVPDEPRRILAELEAATTAEPTISAIVFNGGTGISPRDTTHEAIASVLTKTLPGFGEIFRLLSYQEIGSRAIASRAIAGTYRHLLVFSLPGSRGAVQLGIEKLILPELVHLITQST
ncbi:MogA/MoaB family molybdenum cofactor biosynthesis protein [Chamaesiphon minutus]|uniref:Molybdenum cofactor biosynthesis protein B n=1 Tax=Chamaesiphon minutus (strain ATCC 27169 / PCC 6605) TaxID=1173020 RepID=K9UK09_CHAP6|nr:MogA/MoaB family molybdenum cofactor biosynthesis protein [Chamaesiphon minutus]AFY95432.1 molybdenum cofactor synthesis domain protein [Chamaesiphon minutus PCC 6605]